MEWNRLNPPPLLAFLFSFLFPDPSSFSFISPLVVLELYCAAADVQFLYSLIKDLIRSDSGVNSKLVLHFNHVIQFNQALNVYLTREFTFTYLYAIFILTFHKKA